MSPGEARAGAIDTREWAGDTDNQLEGIAISLHEAAEVSREAEGGAEPWEGNGDPGGEAIRAVRGLRSDGEPLRM